MSEDQPLTREQLLAARYYYRNLAEARLKRIEELEVEVRNLRRLLEEMRESESRRAASA